MKIMNSVTSIVYKPESTVSDPEDHYIRVPLKSANLVAGYGIEGDRKGGNPKRNLNIMTFETLEGLREEGFSTLSGQMGEQIIIQGIDVGKLSEGERLQIGDQALVEVVSHRTGCERFEGIQGKSPKLAAGRMGVMAKVVTGGRIAVGDIVKVLQANQQLAP
jgi:molybdopterin adenylyltransferase